jgi:hypothetical protein
MTAKSLRICDRLTLPADAVTQTFACIGRKGAGKTYLATVLAEQMLDLAAQVVVLDPVGNWWGLRVAADGRSKGKDIFIAGGEHGDVPILPEAGARFARLVVDRSVSIVLDCSGFRQGERKRFAADFAEEFFHRKKTQRSACHLFVEEAQLFCPQRTGPDEARMLGAFENIIRLGRNYGIGATMISQRPQSINKEVLSQVECLCVLQVNGTHERKALEEWVQEAGADRKLVGELPGLARGEGYIWSPSWLRAFQRVRFSGKTTFDASATPEVGKQTRSALLTQVDIEALKTDLAEVVAQAQKDDPKLLRRRIAELERATAAASPAADPAELATLRQQVQDHKRQALDLAHRITAIQREAESCVKSLATAVEARLTELLQDLFRANMGISLVGDPGAVVSFEPIIQRRSVVLLQKPPVTSKTGDSCLTSTNCDLPLRAGARRMLAALCQWFPSGRTEAQLAAQVRMKRTSGTWAAYKSDLRNGGCIEVHADGLWYATEAGQNFAGLDVPGTPATTEDVIALWNSKLRKGARQMLEILVRHAGATLSRDELGAAVGLEPSAGTFAAYLSDLKQAGLIVVDRDGVRAHKENLLL